MTGSVINNIMGDRRSATPTVGVGATELCYTDRHAFTVIEVKDDTHITVQEDTAARTDNHGMSDSQQYEYAPNPDGRKVDLLLCKDGRWRSGVKNRAAKRTGTVFLVGSRCEYHDFSF